MDETDVSVGQRKHVSGRKVDTPLTCQHARLNFTEFKDKIKDLPTPVPIHLQKDDFDLITSGLAPLLARPLYLMISRRSLYVSRSRSPRET